MSNDFAQFQEAFFEEAAEHLAVVEEGLLKLEQNPNDLDLLNQIFRSAHSIKGTSGMFGFTDIAQFTHKMETLLDLLRNGQKVVTPQVADLLLRSTDCLKSLVEAAKSGSPIDAETVQRLTAELVISQGAGLGAPGIEKTKATGSNSVSAIDRSWVYTIAWTPPAWLFQRGLDPLQFFKELRNLGTLSQVTIDTAKLPDFDAMDPEICYLSWTMQLETTKDRKAIEAVFEFVIEDSTLVIEEREALDVKREPAESGSEIRFTNDEQQTESGEPKPLGEILVDSGVVSREALDQALAQQKRVGQILVEQRVASPQQVEQALQKQRKMEIAAQSKKADTTSIRVDTDKIDKLINLVGELVITQSMLSDLGTRFEMSHISVLLERMAQLERNTREIQERVMSIRMLPIGTAFSRFPRLVRDLAAKAGKKIQLVLSGEETELDKTVIESIGDPLTHLVRNSADHGLEPPEERLDNNKQEIGTIRLNAFHQGGNICITVEDDGRGLNRDRIVARAVKQGLIGENEKLSDDQIWPLIFRPGFSTAEKVTDVSGRGVGMDVVKRNIEGLGGTVSIKTTPGHGTIFTLKLPLTLAIIEGMTVRVGQETYIVPLLSILESIQPKPGAVKTIVGKGEVIDVRGTYLPMVRMYEVFALEPEITTPTAAILLILETEGERVAVMVDEILGQQQVVIKSMEQNFRKVEGIAGATILGDGTVGFILDVRGLLEIARQRLPVAA
ncbi:MAG: Chemotaxis protein CheA [Candidatus Nitrospira kreftii]|uniref:Chemotaxis protein CheA n=1 Tax=Candidatus Nitrospira kreftii TaxID=2652173 RepID=A0A7S8FFF7_9BACT|nr:MAG: Chemotaxis protein CheA [Candidatus Nitrospira kreftii]